MRRILSLFIVASLCLPVALSAATPPGEPPTPTPFTRLDAAGTADDIADADLLVVYEHAVNKVKPSGVTYVDGYRLTKVLTGDGCRDNSVLYWHYDPQSQHLEVREVNVLRAGERIAVDTDGLADLPAPQAAIYWRDRIKTLPSRTLSVA